jgi:AraC-like DNA-binding protein
MEGLNRIATAEQMPRRVALITHKFQGEARTGWHSHRRTEFIYATKGFLTLTTEQRKWSAPLGYGLLIAPNVPHELAGFGVTDVGAAFFVNDYLVPVGAECRVLRLSALLQAALESLSKEDALYDPEGRGGHLAAIIEDEISKAGAIDSGLPLPSHPRLRSLCHQLSSSPDAKLDLDELAEITGFSRSTLTRRFRSETGLSIAEWRRRVSIVHFQALHAHGVPAARAAKSAGYSSYRAFKNMIRQHHSKGLE